MTPLANNMSCPVREGWPHSTHVGLEWVVAYSPYEDGTRLGYNQLSFPLCCICWDRQTPDMNNLSKPTRWVTNQTKICSEHLLSNWTIFRDKQGQGHTVCLVGQADMAILHNMVHMTESCVSSLTTMTTIFLWGHKWELDTCGAPLSVGRLGVKRKEGARGKERRE